MKESRKDPKRSPAQQAGDQSAPPSQAAQGGSASEEVERPQYGNVIRRGLDHDEEKDDTDTQPDADESVAPDEDVNPADVDGLSEAHVQRIREKGF